MYSLKNEDTDVPFAWEAVGSILVAAAEGLLNSVSSSEAASGEKSLPACCKSTLRNGTAMLTLLDFQAG